MEQKKIKEGANLKLKNDIIFKSFFGKKENQKFLESLLESILDEPIKVQHITHNTNLEKLFTDDECCILDLEARKSNGELVDIIVQTRGQNYIQNFPGLLSCYAMAKIAEQPEEEVILNNHLKDAIAIGIVDYNIFDVGAYSNPLVSVLESYPDIQINTNIDMFIIELPKFRESNPDMNLPLNQWLSLIDRESENLLSMAKKNNQEIALADKAYNALLNSETIKAIVDVEKGIGLSKGYTDLNEMWSDLEAEEE